MNRFEKVEFLQETCAEGIAPDNQNVLFQELVSWMTENEFTEFYEHFCDHHEICKTYEELNSVMGV